MSIENTVISLPLHLVKKAVFLLNNKEHQERTDTINEVVSIVNNTMQAKAAVQPPANPDDLKNPADVALDTMVSSAIKNEE